VSDGLGPLELAAPLRAALRPPIGRFTRSFTPSVKLVSETSAKSLILLVQLGGLEPPTSCSTDRRSNQLSYNCILGRPQKRGPERGGNYVQRRSLARPGDNDFVSSLRMFAGRCQIF
jgi:hypothetical protein